MMQLWCKKCEDFVEPRVDRWESSIAIIEDEVCPIHDDVWFRERSLEYKPNHPDYHKQGD